MDLVICIVPVSPMRKEAAHRSEMVSQLLFGDCANILEEADDFVRVRCTYDEYEGWCQRSQLQRFSTNNPLTPLGYSASHCTSIAMKGGPAWIPFGCPVYSLEQSSILFGKGMVDYKKASGELFLTSEGFTPERLRDISLRFLNTSYLWGGKSVFGIDCSGFSQQVFKLLGIPLLRDAYLQAEQGEPVADLDTAVTGDLAFFDNEVGRITHVGILLNEQEIVHASGRVRIDRIVGDGIYNEEGRRTHRLHSIRRMTKSGLVSSSSGSMSRLKKE